MRIGGRHPPTGVDGGERERVAGVYGAYRGSRRKRRAWAAGNPGNLAIRAELTDAIWRVAGERLSGGEQAQGAVLDAGCGTGGWLAGLVERGVAPARLHGVDLLRERVAATRERVAAEARRADSDAGAVELRVGDVRALPYSSGRFDVVLLAVVLSSLAGRGDARAALLEARRVTRPGGVVLVYEPRYRSPNRRTVHVPPRFVEAVLGPVEVHRITVWPPLARRLGRLTDPLYPRLRRMPAATSHALTVHRR